MITVIVVIHLLIALAMIGLILMQKTEGNAAGGGFAASANLSSMMQPRQRANPLNSATVVLGILFFGTSIGLALLSKEAGPAPSIFTAPTATAPGDAPRVSDIRSEDAPAATAAPAPPTTGPAPGTAPIAPSFGGASAPPAVPQSGAPAVPNN
jgi:preprotein translocase subunit SecG